jgi:hypothetical protein
MDERNLPLHWATFHNYRSDIDAVLFICFYSSLAGKFVSLPEGHVTWLVWKWRKFA